MPAPSRPRALGVCAACKGSRPPTAPQPCRLCCGTGLDRVIQLQSDGLHQVLLLTANGRVLRGKFPYPRENGPLVWSEVELPAEG